MATPRRLSQTDARPVAAPEVRSPDPIASVSVVLLVLVIVGLFVCAILATYDYNTAPSEGLWAGLTAALFGVVLLINIVARGLRHLTATEGGR